MFAYFPPLEPQVEVELVFVLLRQERKHLSDKKRQKNTRIPHRVLLILAVFLIVALPRYWCFKISRNYSRFQDIDFQDSKILILQDLPRSQDIDFPRCTIIIQDFKGSEILFFPDVLQLSRFQRSQDINFPDVP